MLGTNKNYLWKYQPIGLRRYIDDQGIIISNVTREIDTQRIREIETKTLLKFSEFRKAHCPSCPDTKDDDDDDDDNNNNNSCSGGYFSAIAPEICSSR